MPGTVLEALDEILRFIRPNTRFASRIGGCAGRTLRATMVVKRFGCSAATAYRDLATLARHGVIHFMGAPKTGTYRLRKVKNGG